MICSNYVIQYFNIHLSPYLTYDTYPQSFEMKSNWDYDFSVVRDVISILCKIHRKMILLKYLKIWLDIDLKIILLNYQNNYVGCSNMSDAAKDFDILAAWHNYFNLTKLFLNLYLTKFLDILTILFAYN